MGRPSIDPELLLRILLIGYLYGISSERKLVEELDMHLAWRWFTGLSFDQEIPHHSTFSKNRHGRFQESKLFEQLFEQIVRQCMEVGLVEGKQLSVDGTFVEANAAKQSRVPREQLAEAAQVKHAVREYLQELEEQNPVEEPVHQQAQVSTTDPDSTYATKGGTPARLGYYDNYLVDNHSCVIVGVQATAARMSQETVAAQDMITRFAHWQGREAESVAADTTYGNGEFLQWLADRNITPYMRTRDSVPRKNSRYYGPEHSLQKWAGLAAKGNPTALHFLFSRNHAEHTEQWKEILTQREVFLSRQAAKQFRGFAEAQLRRLQGIGTGKKGQRHELIGTHGYDTKAAMHVIRLLNEGVELMRSGTITLPRPEKDLLITIRTGNYGSLDRVLNLANTLFLELDEAARTSRLPETVNRATVSKLVSMAYLNFWARRTGNHQ